MPQQIHHHCDGAWRGWGCWAPCSHRPQTLLPDPAHSKFHLLTDTINCIGLPAMEASPTQKTDYPGEDYMITPNHDKTFRGRVGGGERTVQTFWQNNHLVEGRTATTYTGRPMRWGMGRELPRLSHKTINPWRAGLPRHMQGCVCGGWGKNCHGLPAGGGPAAICWRADA